MLMPFLSVCSGIEAASCAWEPLGWRAQAFAEIDPFARALLKHRFPDVPNLGDMTRYASWPDLSIRLLCGGTPCQSYSLAGLRKGLADPNGDLMLTFIAIAARYRPDWLVWENVAGVLSSNKGRDFGTFLGLLGHIGYGFAYRLLDAQFFGVAQRRRRVFVVGRLGDWRRAAAVLFERDSLSGHPAPRRQAGQEVARCLTRGSGGGQRYDGDSETFVTGTLCNNGKAAGSATQQDAENGFLVTHTLRGEGFDASEDGTGRGTPLVPIPFKCAGTNVEVGEDVAGTLLRNSDRASGSAQCIAFDCKSSGQNGFGVGVELAGTQRAMGHANSHTNGGGHQAVAYSTKLHNTASNNAGKLFEERTACLDANSPPPALLTAMQVRRLTPRECERLQGFPDDYTAISVRGKPAADGPRYKALGNSWAVPCARWIGERIELVESIAQMKEAA